MEASELTNMLNGISGHSMMNGKGNGLSPENACGEGTVRNGQRTYPYIEILEQPASKALRFRYECEGRSAGSIPGVHSTPENKTYPKIRIVGYKGPAVIVVSCVTKDEPYQAHPHNLVGKEGCKKGICTVKINSEDMTATFQNLGIQCVKKKDIEEALTVREEIRIDPFLQGFNHKSSPSQIDLNAVRLCFQAFLENPARKKFKVIPPVVSEPIYDKKAMSDLVITKLSHASGSVKGGQDMILLCEKVVKEDIEIVFFEEDNGRIIWDSKGIFSTNQVHKQVAISFKTPPYRTTDIVHPVNVHMQLRRPSDKAISESVPFIYMPDDSGYPSKRRKVAPEPMIPVYNDRNLLNTPSPQTPYTSPPHQPQLEYHIKQEPFRSPSYATQYGSSPGAHPYLVPEFHPPSPYDLQYQSQTSLPLPSFNTLASTHAPSTSSINPNPIPGGFSDSTVNQDYTFTVLGQLMEVNPSTSNAGTLFNMNANPPMNESEMEVKHESAISLELRLKSEDLVQNLNGPIDAGELSQNLSQSLNISDFPPTSTNMSDSLSRIVDEKATECLNACK